VRKREGVALIGVSTAIATAPLMATGKVGEEQAEALAEVLEATGKDRLFRIVLIHHSPVARSAEWQRRLIDAARVRAIIGRHGAELILHGHNHRMSVKKVAGPSGPVPVVGAAAASLTPRALRGAGSYNLVRIEGRPGKWRATIFQRRFTHGGIETAGTWELGQ
jgi:3',5'-cyclic AMP phosphodiesterase CpdA